MLTKSDFQQAIADSIASYPAVAPLYEAGDPRILQNLDAMATMLAMLSSQIEVASAEPFEKARDATVLADAAMRGIIRKATPSRVRISVANNSLSSFAIESGRTVLDSSGRPYLIETSSTIPAGSAGFIDAVQVTRETLTHTVANSVPFYAIEVPAPTDGSYLSGIAVTDSDGEYEYRERYVNSFPDERIFHVETDDRQSIYVRFGQANAVGTQPLDGQVITLIMSRTSGDITSVFNSPFSFEYTHSPHESLIDLKMSTLIAKGRNPPDMATLRDLIKYPSVYDHNAVYLGEFDFVVRRAYPDVQFLSVWNESIEENVRGASVDNINTLFVAVLSDDSGETILTEPDPGSPVMPAIIPEENYTDTQIGIKRTIKAADDSYRVRFITPVRSEIAVTVTATVSTSYVSSDVQSKIIEVLLAEYGETASARGSSKPLYRRIYELLKNKVPALSDGNADIKLTVAEPVGEFRPELWRYMSPESLSVTVTPTNVILPSWGG